MRKIPVPDIADPLLQEYWAGLARRKLCIQNCQACGMPNWPPREACYECHSRDIAWEEIAPATGRLFTWTVVHHPTAAGFRDTPYVVGLVELDRFPTVRILGNVVDVDPENLVVSMRLKATFPAAGPKGEFNVVHWSAK